MKKKKKRHDSLQHYHEYASIYRNQITEREKMEINDDVIFEFNVMNGIGGGINKHGVEIFINKDISDAIK